ncbi:MAG TPA: DUF2148 domain-containing protein [Bacteroidales bacterium]|jgi:uncharacterized ferredoxin-like protein|nr:DUF2148 domain-containing protein [Bacteroidales bacterium]HPT10857.1 DUF2148 domain-containing protein [Bacteroidales bacterium]
MKPEASLRNELCLQVAALMLTAARTAPKAKGVDNLELAVIEPHEIEPIALKMEAMASEFNAPAFARDAGNIRQAQALVLLGTRIRSQGLIICGRCGFPNCAEKNKHPMIPCTFNTGDLGIAIGSAVSVAMDHRVDNRIMYTVGQAAMELRLLGDDVPIIYGIPLSISSKNPFFDRK